MSTNTIPPFPSDVPVADIATVDFDLLSQGDAEQARILLHSCQNYGFFYLSNHHVDSRFMFNLADSVFSLPLDEKLKYDMGTTGHYYGYKRSGAMFVDDKGTKDHSEFYNVSKDEVLGIPQPKTGPDGKPRETMSGHHPQVVLDRFDELKTFMKSCHNVIYGITTSLGKSLGLPDGLLESLHKLDQPSVDQARVTCAPPVRPAETITLGEHTDFGSVTVLFNQLGGLQVLAPNKRDWEYVRPRPDCAVINLGDSLIKLLGGRLYSAVHRVVVAPGEQGECMRHSVVYFSRPNSSVKLRDLFQHPTDEDVARIEASSGERLLNADEWVKQRAHNWNTAQYKGKESYKLSRGTEHNRDWDAERERLGQQLPKAVEAV
ncbi:oxidoreductase, 2OG-Fe(II) oxygenase family [Fonsecaea pedrosoi]|nr:oxidoreductase, 2OG-Fe(II) oxygenase family [Fonsecaea pedrosoi]